MVKNKKSLTILLILSSAFFVIGAGLYALAISAIKASLANFFLTILILLAFFVSFGLSAIMSGINLGLGIKSIKQSEEKKFPIIVTIVSAIILLTILVLIIVLVATK